MFPLPPVPCSHRYRRSRWAVRWTGVVAFLALFGSVMVSGARALTLDEAVRRALAGNRDLRAAYFEVDKARGRLLQAGLWPNPVLELNGRTDRAFNAEGEGAVSAAFNQNFPVTGRLRLAREVGRVDVAAALAEIRDRERLLIGEVSRLFVQVLAGREAIAARRELRDLNEAFINVAQQRVAAALGSEVDVNLARIETGRLRQEIALLEAERQAGLFALRLRLGLDPRAALEPAGSLAAVAERLAANTTARGEASLLAGALGRRPDRRALALAVDRAGAEVRLARAEVWSDPTVGLVYDLDRGVDDPEGLSTDQFIGLRVGVPLPLFNRQQGRIREGLAADRQARARVAALDLAIRAEVVAAADRAGRLREVAAGYANTLLPLAGRNADLLRQAYGEGRAEFSLILQAQNQRLGLRGTDVEAQRDRVLALVDLQTAAASSPHLRTDFLVNRPAVPVARRRTVPAP